MSLEYIADGDRMTVTLASGYTSGSGSMSLTTGHGARLPSSGDFWIITTSGTYRAFKVTARSTDTLTVTGGQDDTSDGNLDAGTELEWSLTYSALDQLRADLVQEGAYSSLPSAGKEGRLYLPDDSVYQLRDTGSAWSHFFGSYGKVTNPPSAGWSWVNQGSATLSTVGGVPVMACDGNSSLNLRLRVRSAPSTPYTITTAMSYTGEASDGGGGLYIRENATGEIIRFGIDGAGKIRCTKYTSATVYSADYLSSGTVYSMAPTCFLKLYDNATTRTWSISFDNIGWLEFTSHSNTDFLTADEIGWGLLLPVAIGTNHVTTSLVHWDET